MSEAPSAARLRELVDESEIRALVCRFSRAIDRCDFELLRGCFHPEGTDQHGDFEGSGEDFVAFAEKGLKGFERSMHLITNVAVEIEGDRARSESYCLALARLPADEVRPQRDNTVLQRYLDEHERWQGEWRIKRRVCIYEWTRTDPVPDGFKFPADFPFGLRSREDLSYLSALPSPGPPSRASSRGM